MAEKSKLWDGITTGDHGPYSEGQFSEILSRLFTSDPTLQGPLLSTDLVITDNLPTTPDFFLSVGSAIVDGSLYINTAQIGIGFPSDVPEAIYFRFIIRKNFSEGTVRFTVLVSIDLNESDPQFDPSDPIVYSSDLELVHNTVYWDIPIARGVLLPLASDCYYFSERTQCVFSSDDLP